jgi:DNA invertase Pin-like site-specific DNA recombinase
MAGIAEFYSRNLAAEAIKGMSQKAKVGGTFGRAPIGYLNTRRRVDGREVRVVIVTLTALRSSSGPSRRTPRASGPSARSRMH